MESNSITRYMPTAATSETFAQLAAALAKAQGAMKAAEMDGLNPHFKSRYATLANVWDAARKPLSDNGLALTQIIQGQTLITLLIHESGEWIQSTYDIGRDTSAPQPFGSATSYARRYSMAAIIGMVADEDDDGNVAQAQRKGNRQDAGREPSFQKPQPKQPVRSFTEQVQDHFANLAKEQGGKPVPAKGIWGATVGILDGMVDDTQVRMRVLSLLTGRAIESSNDLKTQERNALIASVKPAKNDTGDWTSGNDKFKAMVDRLLDENPQPQEESDNDSSDA